MGSVWGDENMVRSPSYVEIKREGAHARRRRQGCKKKKRGNEEENMKGSHSYGETR